MGLEVKPVIDVTSKVYCTCPPGLRSDSDDEGPVAIKDVGATERASLVSVKRRDGVVEKTALVEVMRTS